MRKTVRKSNGGAAKAKTAIAQVGDSLEAEETSLCGMSLRRCWIALSSKHYFKRGKLGGFKRSSQRDPFRLIEVTGQATLRAISNQVSCGAES